MLKSTTSLTTPAVSASTETTPAKKCRVSGFRDFPDGGQNQRFNYDVKDFEEALTFLERSRAKGQRFRSVYFTNQLGINNRIPNDGLTN